VTTYSVTLTTTQRYPDNNNTTLATNLSEPPSPTRR
jgi:hypothetical protein